MPSIDMGDALNEPSFRNLIHILRRQETFDNTGAPVRSIIQNITGAVVTVSANNDMDRDPALSMNHKGIMVITRFRLRSVSETLKGVTYQPDLILWRGDHYIVKTLEDWSAYGQGWVAAECTLFQLVGTETYQFVPFPRSPTKLLFANPTNSGLVGALS